MASNKVLIIHPAEAPTSMRDLKVGQFAVITDTGPLHSQFNGHVVVKTFAGVVSLTNPRSTWTMGARPNFPVKVIEPRAVIEITVSEPDKDISEADSLF